MTTDADSNIRFDLESSCDEDASEDEEINIDDRYVFDTNAKLGQGAYGSVFRGFDTSQGRAIAVKIVPSDRVKLDELEAISRANRGDSSDTSYVVRLLDLIELNKFTYIVMELCHTDLEEYLRQRTRLDPSNFDSLIRCMAEGYLFLFRLGIVHRDIKPQNILLNLDYSSVSIVVAKFADFGCCRVTTRKYSQSIDGGEQIQIANCAGTFHYMAPEVGANLVNCHKYDEAVDMWSIGVVLFQATTGRVPFTEQQLCRLFLRAVDQNYTSYTPPAFDQVDDDQSPSVSPHNHEIIHRLLQLDPAARLSPTEFHSYVAHDRPSTFLKCLNEGSCSASSKISDGAASARASSSNRLSSTLRRTASGVFGRIRNAMSGCNVRLKCDSEH